MAPATIFRCDRKLMFELGCDGYKGDGGPPQSMLYDTDRRGFAESDLDRDSCRLASAFWPAATQPRKKLRPKMTVV
jgi:hypothetical protein